MSRCARLEADAGHDVAGPDTLEVFPVVGMHFEDAPDALFPAGAGIDHLAALIQLTAVHPEVGEFAHMGVAHDLECQGAERSIVVGGPLALFAFVGPLHWGHVQRGGEIIDDRVQ